MIAALSKSEGGFDELACAQLFSNGAARVDLKTDARNHRCRRALERLGIGFEGAFRNWSMSWAPGKEGMLQDSVMFAAVASEWPTVRQALLTRLASRDWAG